MATLCAVIKSVVTKSGTVCVEYRKHHCLCWLFVGSALIVGEKHSVSLKPKQRVSSIHDYDILSWSTGRSKDESFVQTKTSLKLDFKLIFLCCPLKSDLVVFS